MTLRWPGVPKDRQGHDGFGSSPEDQAGGLGGSTRAERQVVLEQLLQRGRASVEAARSLDAAMQRVKLLQGESEALEREQNPFSRQLQT